MSAIEGAEAVERGACMVEVDRDGSNIVDIFAADVIPRSIVDGTGNQDLRA